ncbi:hypothetical protein A3744_13725 [Oleiphilus sp. HI0073]|nr:hypothetical protein A3744_18440 [Oleiphilus sp. HI0073]KZY96675.1 hypothetical protein A3744_13725 [Oleiphilus sp. HI0073]
MLSIAPSDANKQLAHQIKTMWSHQMGEQFANWYKEQGEYITGGLFALIVLDIFMFLMHCITEKTTEGYGLMTLVIALSIGALAWIEKLYSQQEESH